MRIIHELKQVYLKSINSLLSEVGEEIAGLIDDSPVMRSGPQYQR